jgi:arylsulfatase A-like enzyme
MRGALGCGAAVLAVAVFGCTPRDDPRPNIVVIVLDTARPDRLSVYGHERPTSPALEAFAAQGTRFDRAYSSSSWTLPAHASLFTGTSPEVHEARQRTTRVVESLPMLPEQLADAGYYTAGFSGNMWLSEFTGLDRGFDHFENRNRGHYIPHIRALANDFAGRPIETERHFVAQRVLDWLEWRAESEQPFFLFVNLIDAHMPYLPDWRAARHFLENRNQRWRSIQRFYPQANARRILYRHYARRRPFEPIEWEALDAMYQGALRVADRLAGDIIAAVDAVSDPKNTLVFVLSDHGENLGDHGHIGHIFNLYESNVRIACLARGPGFAAGAHVDRVVHITDVHRTLLDAAGVTAGARAEGVDLRGAIPENRVVYASLDVPRISLEIFPEAIAKSGDLERYRRYLNAAIGERYKLIRAYDEAGKILHSELYDLETDPDETHALPPEAADADALGRLRETLDRNQRHEPKDVTRSLDDLPEETRAGLRALGYLDDETPDSTQPDERDP